MSHAKNDLDLLGMANEKGKFALDIMLVPSPELQEALERGIDNDWFTLVDVSPVAAAPRHLLRVFKLTPSGMKRLHRVRQICADTGLGTDDAGD